MAMTVIGQWAVWLVLVFALAALMNKKPVETAAPAAFFVILLLYLGGLLGNLLIGMGLVWLCAGAGAVYLAVSWASPAGPDGSGNKKRLARRWGWALGGFALIGVWLLCLAWGRRLSAWDDLSHWGLAVKNMITLDKHHCVLPSTTTFRGYPPASSLFEYFFARFAGQQWEAAAVFGLDVLMTSCLLPALRCASRRQWWKTLLLGGALLAFPVVFYERVYTIVYVDMLLALLTAYLIFTALHTDRLDQGDLISLCLGAGTLTLVKETGLAMLGFALAVILVVWLTRDGRPKNRAAWMRLLAVPVAMLLFGLLLRQSWVMYRTLYGSPDAWVMPDISPEEGWVDLLEELGDADSPYTQCLHNFCKLLFGSKRYYLWGAGIGTVYFYWGKRSGRKKPAIAAAVALWVGFGIYAASLLYLYLYSGFGADPNLPSMERYLYTYLAMGWFSGAMLLANLSLAAPTPRNKKKNAGPPVFLAVCFAASALLLRDPYYVRALVPPFCFGATQRFNADRAFSQPATGLEEALDMDPNSDRVCLVLGQGVSQWSGDYDRLALALEFAPIDSWTTGGYDNARQWASALAGSSYLYLCRAPENFTATAGSLFDGPILEDTLYRVEHTDGDVRLTLAQP